jgi:hypothetical protein
MTRYDEIRGNSQAVIASASGLGRIWEYRRLTSNRAVEPRTYGVWTPFIALDTGGRAQQEYDEQRRGFMDVQVLQLRAMDSDPSPRLTPGCQVRVAGETEVWAVMGVNSSGPGTLAYTLKRDLPLLQDENRKGGL